MIRQGDVLNNTYVIKEQLGAGGGGIIYKAYHQRLKTDVVVKQIKDEVKGHIEGRSEADVLKRLRHSNLPRVYDFLEIDDDIYTVMDFIPGCDLKQAMAQNGGRFSQKQVLQWARELAEALAYLHSMKPPIIHSDIKPSNIMLQPDGHICLIDFNVSLAFDNSKRTSTGVSAGFSPPEQYHSKDMYRTMSGIGANPTSGSAQTMDDEDETAPVSRRGGRANGYEDDETATVAGRNQSVGSQADSDTAVVFRSRQQGGRNIAGIGNDNNTYTGQTGQMFRASSGNAETDLVFSQARASGGPDTVTVSVLEKTLGRGIDERSDIYSLGATLYMLLTGIKPTSHYWEIIPIDKVNKVSKSRIEISEGLALIIKKMMEIDPANRYQSGMELKKALDNIFELDNEYRKYKAKARVRWVVIAALFAASAGLLASGYFVMQRERGNEYNREILEARESIAARDYEHAGELVVSAQKLIAERVDAYEVEMQRLYSLERYEECIHYGSENINSPVYYITTEADRSSLANMFYLLGNAYYEVGDYKNAVKCFEQAIQNQAGNNVYYRDLAISLAKQGNVDDAEKALREARAHGLGEDSIYMTEGEIAYAKQDYAKAVEIFKQVLGTTDNDEIRIRTVLLCADAYRQLDSSYYQEQIQFLESYENAIGGRGAQLTEVLAEAYAKNGEKQKAIGKFQELIGKGLASYQIYENLAILQQESDDLDGARVTLETMDDLYPDRYETYKRLAFLEADIQSRKENRQRDYHQMKEYYDKAQALCEVDDVEMQRLTKMMDDIRSGGWL